MSGFHLFVMLEALLKEGIHLWIEFSPFTVNLVEKKLHGTDLLPKAHQNIVSGFVTSVAHRDTIWMRPSLDVLPTRAKGNDMFNSHTIVFS